MAGNGLTRKFMTALGVSSEAQDEIIAKYDEVLTDIKTERDTYKQKAEQLDQITAERDELQQKLNNPEQADRVAELKRQLAEYQAKETNGKKRTALTELLEEIGVDKGVIPLVLKGADLNSMELDGDTLKNRDTLAQSYRNELSAYVRKETEAGKMPPSPPANNSGRMTKDQIMAIKDRKERQTAIAQNLDLFENKKGE